MQNLLVLLPIYPDRWEKKFRKLVISEVGLNFSQKS